MAAFNASARVMDEGVGAVLRALESRAQAANMLVIPTTDHGIPFPAMKCNCTDHGMGVSLIARGPGGFSGGKVVDAMVSHLGLFPTIASSWKSKNRAGCRERRCCPGAGRGTGDSRGDLRPGDYHAAYEPQRAVRTHRWKYIRRFDGRAHPNLPNCDDGPGKSRWLNNGWRERTVDAETLYDLVFDPKETRNAAGDPAYRAALEKMRGRLDRWMHGTKDPILRGPIAAPPGALANDPEGISPNETPKAAG
jgi:N-sulfoglucosamine sulfohydrolase